MKLIDLIAFVEKRWPTSTAADWDNPGLAVGSTASDVRRCLLSVDVTPAVLDEAIETEVDLIFSHHPFLLRGISSVSDESFKGALITKAIRHGISMYSAHTNADFVVDGVSQTLAKTLGVKITGTLTESEGVVGEISPTRLVDFARAAGRLLPSVAQGVLVQGDPERIISKIGIVAGAGDSYLGFARAAELDLYITSDLRHHPSSDFRDEGGPGLMNIAHYSAEWPWLNQAATELGAAFPDVEFVVSELNTDPWDFAVMQ